jgi:hypothetical protein
MGIKDFLSLFLAALALVISAGTGYFNIIRQSDDVRVVAQASPHIEIDNSGTLEVSGQQVVTFINLGNRDFAVTGLTMVFYKLSSPPQTDNNCDTGSNSGGVLSLVYDFEPFILKPADIIVRSFESTRFPGLWVADPKASHLKKFAYQSVFSKGDWVFTCLRFSITTPGVVIDHAYAPVHYIEIKDLPHTGISATQVSSFPNSNKPYPLYVLTGFPFGH